ncbi:hypothetical protein E2C01_046923 [Portunus trituberculatus]|uniref:Uncharacterized protein n=1 Tax=Portunus trituberculatus TaxID=210409 RepID=A0A5B7G631_PORTR|nr:hypothetical protein [Portunus trituberculatus]
MQLEKERESDGQELGYEDAYPYCTTTTTTTIFTFTINTISTISTPLMQDTTCWLFASSPPPLSPPALSLPNTTINNHAYLHHDNHHHHHQQHHRKQPHLQPHYDISTTHAPSPSPAR